jgi:hypothetical protein
MVYTLKYCFVTDCYTKSGLTSTQVDLTINDYQLIQEAELEIETLTGRKFTASNTFTEYLNGGKKDIVGYTGNKATTCSIQYWPIQSITSFLILNTDGTTYETYDTVSAAEIIAGTYQSEDYWLDTIRDTTTGSIVPYGKVTLISDTFPTGTRNIKIAGTYGYTTVPAVVRNLATTMTAIRMWITFMGGQYNRLDSYAIPQQTVSKGNFYERGQKMITLLTEEANRLLDRIGRRPVRIGFASGEDR